MVDGRFTSMRRDQEVDKIFRDGMRRCWGADTPGARQKSFVKAQASFSRGGNESCVL